MAGHTYQFGRFYLDERARLLLRDGTPASITPKVFETLLFMLANAGRTVSREELIQAVWPDTFVEEGNLNYTMSQLRKILGERRPGVPYIQTVPKFGYRFIADPQETQGAATVRDEPPAPTAHSSKHPYRVLTSSLAGLVVLLATVGVWRVYRPASVPFTLGQISGVSRVTAYPGDERAPSLSPDGAQVAFSWTGEKGTNRDIYVTRIGATSSLRLTWDNAEDDNPAWSPDGSQIAFIRQYDTKHGAIVLVPALGGPERKLYTFVRTDYPASPPMLAWSSDGRAIVFPFVGDSDSGGISLLSLETGRSQVLVRRDPRARYDSSPAISPNGEWLAFTRYHAQWNGQLMVQRLGAGFEPSGEPFAIPGSGQAPRSPFWSPDSKHLVFNDDTRVLEWQHGSAVRVAYALNGRLGSISVIWRGASARVIAASLSSDEHIWMLPIDPGTHTATGSPTRWVASTMNEEKAHYSPDGRTVAFVSDSSGAPELWLADAAGGNPRQLTHMGGYITGFTRWSPDGKRIAFHARIPDTAQIYLVDVDVGVPRRLSNTAFDLVAPSWSLDGRHVYACGAEANDQVYRLRVDDGFMEPLFEGRLPLETPDGKRLLYGKASQFGVFARLLERDPIKNPEQRLVDDYTGPLGGIFLVPNGFFYTSFSPLGIPRAFRFFDYAEGKAKDIAPAPPNLGVGLTVSPNQRQLLYSAGEKASGYDLLMLEFQGTGEVRH